MKSKLAALLVIIAFWVVHPTASSVETTSAVVGCCGGDGDSLLREQPLKRTKKLRAISTVSAKAVAQTTIGRNPYAGEYTLGYTIFSPCYAIFTNFILGFDNDGTLIYAYGSGQIAGAEPLSNETLSGTVDQNGNVSCTFSGTRSDGLLHTEKYRGRFTGDGGDGSISIQIGTRFCSGAWWGGRRSDGLPDAKEELHGDPVNTATGAFVARHMFLNQNTSTNLNLTLDYSSDALKFGPLGKGWTHKYETKIDVKSSDIIALNQNGQRRNWFVRDGTTSVFRCDERGVQYDTITKNPDGSFVLNRNDQSRIDFNSLGQMTRWTSSTGESLTFDYSSDLLSVITDSISGRHLSFGYNDGLLYAVADDSSRYVWLRYGINGALGSIVVASDTNGDLKIGGSDQIASEMLYGSDPDGRITAGRDGNGVLFVTNSYDSQGRVVSQDDARKETPLTRFAYDDSDPEKRTTTVTDRNGRNLKYVYDRDLQMTEFWNQSGDKTAFTYDENFNRTSLTTPVGETTTFEYDAVGNLLKVTDHYGRSSSMAFDSRNNLTRVTDPGGKATTFSYDAKNNVTASTNPLNQTVGFTYDGNSLLTRRTSSRSGQTNYTYTAGLPTSIQDANLNATSMEYDGAGRLVRIVDPAGFAVAIEYDIEDNLIGLTDQRGKKTTFTYDRRKRKTSETNALGETKRWIYDGNGNVTSSIDPLGKVTKFSYDGEDRLVAIVDPLGKRTTLTYDSAGRLVAITDAYGKTRRMEHDGNGNVTKTIDARGNSTLTEYLIDLPFRTTDPLARVSTFSYDAKRRLQEATNPLGEKTGFGYDDIDRLTTVSDALNQTTRQAFDADGNRNSMTNARNAATSFTFDLARRLSTEATPGGKTTRYSYDNRDLVSSIVEPSGQTTSFTYDASRRLTRTEDPVAGIDYTYDDVGRLLTVVEGGKTISRKYDRNGRLVEFTDGDGNRLKYDYDAVGNLTKLVYPDGKVVKYAYDAANRMSRVTDWKGRTTKYAYDADGRLTMTTRPNGTVELRTWNEAGELAEIIDRRGDAVISSFKFTRDLAGRIIAENPEPLPGAYLPQSFTASYDQDNRLTSFNGASVTFDADGNMTSGPVVNGTGTGAFTYDSRNRLVSFDGMSYGYDAEDRRISITDAAGTTSLVVNPNAELSQILVRSAADGYVTRAVYGLGLLYEDDGKEVRYFHFDYRGNAVAFSNARGVVTGRLEYGPFGELASSSGDVSTPFLFNARFGVMTDSNGLYYLRVRYYHPRIKRFINQDGVLGEIGLGGSMNRFAYANGNPISFIDPFGLEAQDPTLGEKALSIGLDFIPIVGTGKSLYELFSGRDLVTGEYVPWYSSVLGIIPFGKALTKFGKVAKLGEEAIGGTALARKLGKAGEEAVGIGSGKVRIKIPGSDRFRIPDRLTETTVTEVKNVKSLSYTSQLRDYSTYARATGRSFELYVRPTTQLSGPLQEAVSKGDIILRIIP